jgi:hypothetical protein
MNRWKFWEWKPLKCIHKQVNQKAWKLNFLFMDDSYTETTKLSCLTGVVVPVEQYPMLRSEFYEALRFSIQPEETVIAAAPELHGSDFLRNECDEKKLAVMRDIAVLVAKHCLRIYRVGYFITDATDEVFRRDKKLVGLCWVSLLSMMEPLLRDEMVVPVMDGFNPDTIRFLSSVVKELDKLRSVGFDKMLSVRYSHNVLGEVFYADSRYSALIQVADLIAYLRATSDLVALGKTLTDFKKELATISSTLDSSIVWEERVSLIVDGQIQGPTDQVRPLYKSFGPITRVYRITPSDTEDITVPNDPIA